MSQDDELRELIKGLYDKIDGLELRISKLEILDKDVPEDTLVAIAAAVAAYLGHKAKRRQRHLVAGRNWTASTRRSQHVHHPLYSR